MKEGNSFIKPRSTIMNRTVSLRSMRDNRRRRESKIDSTRKIWIEERLRRAEMTRKESEVER